VTPRWLVHPWNRGWWSDHHPRWSDCLALHSSFVSYFVNFHHAPRGTHNFDYAPCGAHNPTRASHSSAVPALLTLPLGCAGATSTTSTSAVAAGEGRTCGTSGQPSSDDHVDEVRLPATSQQTHTVGHLVVTALSGAHLHPCHPCQPVLASCHGGRM
jgi:hypothetical protein